MSFGGRCGTCARPDPGPAGTSRRRDLPFRYEKLVGTVRGIVDGPGLTNPARRAEMFFETGFTAVVQCRGRIEHGWRASDPEARSRERCSCAWPTSASAAPILKSSKAVSVTTSPGWQAIRLAGPRSSTIAAVGPRVTGIEEGQRVVVECIQGCGECADCKRDEAFRCRDRKEVRVIGQDGAYR